MSSDVSMSDVGTYQELANLIRNAANAVERANDFCIERGISGFRDLELDLSELNGLRYRAEERKHEAERLRKEAVKP